MTRARIIVFIFVLIGFTMWPLVLQRSVAAAVLLALTIVAWIVWSVIAYLMWARTLGRDGKAGDSSEARRIL